jgi:hypothetical protein
MMNTQQKAYIQAKAIHESANDRMDELEADFLASRGRDEKHIHAIDDDSAFDLLNTEFSEESKEEWAALVRAREDLKQAENDLIAYGLSIIPKKYAEILRSSRNIKVRQEMIELAFRLDIRTVPQKYIA